MIRATTLIAMSIGTAFVAVDWDNAVTQETAYSAFSESPERHFDFWEGVWDVVDLDRTRTVLGEAEASVYSLLDGKLLLELWDSRHSTGVSLRHYDASSRQWHVWRYWPDGQGAQPTTLRGQFHHGRGEFMDVTVSGDDLAPDTTISRYTFSDITPFSLRREHAWTGDGAQSWVLRSFMEFTRTAEEPRWPIRRSRVPTYSGETLCGEAVIEKFSLLEKRWVGVEDHESSFEFFTVVEGCALLGVLVGDIDEVVIITFDSRSGEWVMTAIEDTPGAGFVRYVGKDFTTLASDRQGEISWVIVTRSDEPQTLIYERGGRRLEFQNE